MSRSRRHNPITGITTAESDKQSKREANRALRAAERAAFTQGKEVPLLREVSDSYFEKDGKQRFDPAQHPKLMRK